MNINLWRVFHPSPEKPSLQRAIAGRDLTGIMLDDGNLLLRFTDAQMVINLSDRTFRFQHVLSDWITFPGWIRISRVIEDQSQIILEVSGALFTARIAVRQTNSDWMIVFQGGRILASA
jgi:hypothetical protein